MENNEVKGEVIKLVDWLSKPDNLKKLSNKTFFHTSRLMAQAILAEHIAKEDKILSFKDIWRGDFK